MSQKFPVNDFKWIEETSHSIEDFKNIYIEDRHIGYFNKNYVQYSKKMHGIYNDLPFLTERMKTEKIEKLVTNLRNKKNMFT